MREIVKNAGLRLLNALLPRTCLACGLDLPPLAGEPLCAGCLGSLTALRPPFCMRCGLPLPGGRCPDCRAGGALGAARSALVFDRTLSPVVHAFKYGDREDLAPFLGGLMAGALDGFPELEGHLFAVPVPLHPGRLRERGYNQAALLARELSARRGLFPLEGAATRVRATPSQTKLSRAERRRNVQGAFAVAEPGLVRGRKLLLVDDVATTLATLEELAAELRKAGAASVAAFTLAREP